MGTVSLEILKNYILSEGGVVSSQQIVRHFQPFLKDPANKARNKELFKSYLSTLTDYRHEEGSNVRILELKKDFRSNDYFNSPQPKLKENTPRNEPIRHQQAAVLDKYNSKPSFKDQLQPMRDFQRSAQRDTPRDVQRDDQRGVQRDTPRDVQRDDQRGVQRDIPRDVQRDGQRDAQRNTPRDVQRNGQRDVQRNTPRDIPPAYHQNTMPTHQQRGNNRSGSRSHATRTGQERQSPAQARRGLGSNRQQASSTQRPDSQDDGGVVTPTKADQPVIRTASINAINMFNRTAQQKSAARAPTQPSIAETDDTVFHKTDTLDSNAGEECREEMESGCSNVNLEQNEKEWIVKSALGDCDTISRLLLTERSLVQYKDFISGYTGLHWSCKLGRLDITRVLLDAGSDPAIRSHSGQTPLHLAALTGKGELIDLLIKYGADKETRDYKGKKPEHYLPATAAAEVKSLLVVVDPRSNNKSLPQQRKFSKSATIGFDSFSDLTPKRHHTINQAWKKLKAPSGFKSSFVTKKSKSQKNMDSNKRETVNNRGDSKENRKYDRSQTLPTKQTVFF